MTAWKDRELGRFATGHYKKLPFPLDAPTTDPRAEHFPHLSKDDPLLMAYTQSPEKGERDVKTKIKPGVYLRKFFSDRFSAPEIAALAATVRATTGGDATTLHIATTPEECVTAYKAITGSCMSYPNDGYQGHIHPAHAYGSPDERYVTVAYIKRGNNITAKALINRASKTAQSFHGDVTTLKMLLKAQGYNTECGYGAPCLNGLLLHAIPAAPKAGVSAKCDDGRLRYIAPAIDGHITARHDATLGALVLVTQTEYDKLRTADKVRLGYYHGLTQ